ncbi:MAG TPA: DNA mismatch repair endonuclease MutL, partial [Thermoplasmata archaeon]|nr:DNA mismatch repair endonuclease MutL [Thermoplasmata archaeon]
MTLPELAAARRPIRRLDPRTVERIAAGEVVERPASVVKELIENAIDAGATEVRVHLVGGGMTALRVDDDGWGIPPEELPLAVERHATSKLGSAEELAGIGTLGFRGEALASIATVARLSLTSRVASDDAAHQIRLSGGTVEGTSVAGRPPGTTVEVRDLFYNTPARRKFLRSPASEQVEVATTVERMYLARPEVGITLSTEAGELGRYPRSTSLRDAAARVFGPEFLAQSFPVEAPLGGDGRIEAVLGRPSVHRPTSGALHLAVNGRAIVSRPLAQAVRAAFIDFLPRARFPVGVVSLRLPADRVDVNVHPTKREVRFADERGLYEMLRSRVRESLLQVVHVAEPAEPLHPVGSAARSRPVPVPTALPRPRVTAGRQRSLVDAPSAPALAATARHPALRLLGCMFNLYWVAESEASLVLVDQHAASERVVFDALRREGRLGRQEL